MHAADMLDAQVDTVMMKHFLSAFSDEDVMLIIKHCKQVLVPGGCILLLQTLVPEAGDRAHNTCEDGVVPGEAQHTPSRSVDYISGIPQTHIIAVEVMGP
jgi:predicted SAM-dependent methyltransferase